MKEETTVRENLMNEKGYAPYCGNPISRLDPKGCSNPRTVFDERQKQFVCPECGWTSEFPKEFIERYIDKWKMKEETVTPSPETFRKVFMRTDCDCMIASLAMLLRCSYEAAAQFFPAIAIKKKGYNWEYLTPFLKANGIYLTWAPSKNEVNWNKPAMIDVSSLTAPDKGDHIIFWDGKQIIDPSNKEVRYTEVPEEINCAYQISENWTRLPLYLEPESEGQSKEENEVINTILYHIKLNVEMDMQSAIEHQEVEDSSYYEGVENECKQVIDLINKVNIADFTNSPAKQITDQPKETADPSVVKKNLTTETGRANYTDFGKQTQDALPVDYVKSDFTGRNLVPADQPQPTKRTKTCECEIPYFPTGNIHFCSKCNKPTIY